MAPNFTGFVGYRDYEIEPADIDSLHDSFPDEAFQQDETDEKPMQDCKKDDDITAECPGNESSDTDMLLHANGPEVDYENDTSSYHGAYGIVVKIEGSLATSMHLGVSILTESTLGSSIDEIIKAAYERIDRADLNGKMEAECLMSDITDTDDADDASDWAAIEECTVTNLVHIDSNIRHEDNCNCPVSQHDQDVMEQMHTPETEMMRAHVKLLTDNSESTKTYSVPDDNESDVELDELFPDDDIFINSTSEDISSDFPSVSLAEIKPFLPPPSCVFTLCDFNEDNFLPVPVRQMIPSLMKNEMRLLTHG